VYPFLPSTCFISRYKSREDKNKKVLGKNGHKSSTFSSSPSMARYYEVLDKILTRYSYDAIYNTNNNHLLFYLNFPEFC